jgi:ferredoxin-NADP reductase
MINNPASTIETGSIELVIKLIGDHPVTNWIYNDAQVNDKVKLCGGQGQFYFDKSLLSESTKSVVLLAGGIGGMNSNKKFNKRQLLHF